MFRFSGNGTSSENLTFGNYCNVDLLFPLKPSLGRAKRATAIVQAQLIHCNGDKILARNTWFISRLNLCPFAGAKRVLFDRCHFESTDDALCSTGLYVNSVFDFYSSKPFYNTRGTGAVLLNCDVRSMSGSSQYFTKAGGQVTVVDSRFTGDPGAYWGWQEVVPKESRNYQHNVRLNGKPLLIGSRDAASTVQLADKDLLNAYRFMHADTVVYNTYNLLRGDDDWDPMGIKALVIAAEKKKQTNYAAIPVQLIVSSTGPVAETKKNNVNLTAKLFRFGNYAVPAQKISWSVEEKDKALVKLVPGGDGVTCTVLPTNGADNGRDVVITASTASGLQGASVINILPQIEAAPMFKSKPSLSITGGKLQLAYLLNSNIADASDITWYRSADPEGDNAIEVAVSRQLPMKEYALSVGDIGYWIKAVIKAKTVRSQQGPPVSVVLNNPISANDVKRGLSPLKTDFSNQSLRNQPRIIPGFFSFMPAAIGEPDPANRADSTKDAWHFGPGAEGAAGMEGLLQVRHARMTYTPVGENFTDMRFKLVVSPYKTAGQGFSVAPLYMDVLVKMDASKMTGYALRFIRTTKYGNAVDCILMKYTGGDAVPISDPVTTSAYRTPCTITISVTGTTLHASVQSASPGAVAQPGVQPAVSLKASITPNNFGGFGIEYHGGSPTMINNIVVKWAGK
jgi:hypothetical protein